MSSVDPSDGLNQFDDYLRKVEESRKNADELRARLVESKSTLSLLQDSTESDY